MSKPSFEKSFLISTPKYLEDYAAYAAFLLYIEGIIILKCLGLELNSICVFK